MGKLLARGALLLALLIPDHPVLAGAGGGGGGGGGGSGGPEDTTCTASATTINFGSFDILAGTPLDGAGSFTVTCVHNKNTSVTVTWTASAAVTPARQMAPPSGSDVVTYQLYVDSGRTQVWGDGTGGTFTISGSLTVPTGAGSSATSAPVNYYGRITPGGQDVSATSPGPAPTTYSQSIVVTVTCTPTTAGC